MYGRVLLPAVLALSLAAPSLANDSAAEIAVGGIQARKEERVLMEKERLFISKGVVEVEYEFRNLTDQPVTTEIAFPIPPFEYSQFDNRINVGFDDFKVWIDGKAFDVQKEIRAFVGGREITAELQRANVDIENFGFQWSYDQKDDNRLQATSEFQGLPNSVRAKFVEIGAIEKFHPTDKSHWPLWEVRLNYHWSQTFPPQSTTRIKHRYAPSVGYEYVRYPQDLGRIKGGCLTDTTMRSLQQCVDRQEESSVMKGFLISSWVSYILTTANTWKTPIRDFELVVEKAPGTELAFCWDGPVERVGENRFKARKTDFVPKDELKVYFFKEM